MPISYRRPRLRTSPTLAGQRYAGVSGRMRDTHDLWHVLTGYSGDVLGETALLGFIFAQTGNPGVALIIALGC